MDLNYVRNPVAGGSLLSFRIGEFCRQWALCRRAVVRISLQFIQRTFCWTRNVTVEPIFIAMLIFFNAAQKMLHI